MAKRSLAGASGIFPMGTHFGAFRPRFPVAYARALASNGQRLDYITCDVWRVTDLTTGNMCFARSYEQAARGLRRLQQHIKDERLALLKALA